MRTNEVCFDYVALIGFIARSSPEYSDLPQELTCKLDLGLGQILRLFVAFRALF